MELGEPDASGRRRPEPISGSEHVIPCEVIISAIGIRADAAAFAESAAARPNGTLEADAATCQTQTPWLFAAGDVVNGATDITRAVGEGRRAAHMIDRWLNGRADGRLRPAPAGDRQGAGARSAEGVHLRPAAAEATA